MDAYPAIHVAALHGHLDLIKFIAKYIKDINPASVTGFTPIYGAVQYKHLDVLKFYLNSNITNKNPIFYTAYWRIGNSTPLSLAIETGETEFAKLILDHLEDKNPTAEDGRSTLHIAARLGNLELVQLLVENINDINKTNPHAGVKYNNYTPFHVATINNHTEVVKYLARKILDVNEKNMPGFIGYTAYDIA